MQSGRDYLVFEYTDALARARVEGSRRGVWGSIISLVITLVFLAVLVYFQRDLLESSTSRAFFAVFIGIGLLGIVIAVVRFIWARQDLRRIQPGPALVVDRGGIHVAGTRVEWHELESFGTKKRWLGGPEYVIKPAGQAPILVGVEHLANFPATVDSAVRILSAGRGAIELSGIDH